ncbi:hypothetical protein E2P81_ATG11061 [Venturia nashicola]|uniref:F-box domain-containing protein n=1 Tax=Venturia nashicola TaxID=86259 RepID=A0A4Z1P2L7_9PEZI|nr:hypothetical protein E6O75_ATG10739 [Venturia nashicola]TLD27773.1 hypothetical protein E2P81_ATG11061 [Venturia nashicola]
MPIGGGYCVSSSAKHALALSLSSFELDSSTTKSLKESLLALEPITGTVAPSGWTTVFSAATTSSSQNPDGQSPNGKQLNVVRSETFLGAASFSVLPENVLERIFSELPLKSDQRALTLISKKTYSLLLKDLYFTVIVDISSYPDITEPLLEMLNIRNPGREYIRVVFFNQSNLEDKQNPPTGFQQLARMFLKNLPFGQLEHFGWPADYIFSPKDSLRLWQTQPQLENIELYEHSCENSIPVKNAINQMKNVVSLRLSPDSEAGLKSVDKILRNIKTIVSLHVDFRTFSLPRNKDASLVPQKLFSSAMTAALKLNPNAPWKMPLTHLALWNVDLGPASCAIWARALNFASLQVIQFSHCLSVENILAHMAEDPRPSQLHALTINHRVPTDAIGHSLSAALTKILEKAPPLSELILRIQDLPDPPSWGHVALHASSLETLLLDMDGPNRYSPGELMKITTYTSDRLRHFGFVIDSDQHPSHILHHLNLVTVYLLGEDHGCATADSVFDYCEQMHQTRGNCSDLPLRLRTVAVQQGNRMVCYVRGETKVLRRKPITSTVEASLRELTHCGEEVNILIGEPMEFGPGGRR